MEGEALRVVHSKVQQPERTVPHSSASSSVPLEAFYGPAWVNRGPINAPGFSPVLPLVSTLTAQLDGA